jgi:hypothetical protein
MFSSERLVVLEEPGGEVVASIFVDGSLVEVDVTLRGDEAVPGRIKVELRQAKQRLNVFLPAADAEHGRVVSLSADLLVA